jgi:hypothetical protein
MEPWSICNGCSNKVIWAQICQTSYDSESFDYFKICEDLEEMSMMKSVPDLISHLQEFCQMFPHYVSIFLVQKYIFENGKRADVWDPPVSHSVAGCHAVIGWPGWWCTRLPTASVQSRPLPRLRPHVGTPHTAAACPRRAAERRRFLPALTSLLTPPSSSCAGRHRL